MDTRELMTIKEAAALMGVAAPTVYQAIEEGRIPCVVALGRKAVYRSDIDAYIQRVRPNGVKPKGRPKKERAEA